MIRGVGAVPIVAPTLRRGTQGTDSCRCGDGRCYPGTSDPDLPQRSDARRHHLRKPAISIVGDLSLLMPTDAIPSRAQTTLALLRGALVVILTFGLVGVLAELFLLEHTEEAWQRLPVFMLIASLVILAWHAVDRGPLSVQVLRVVMALFIITGVIGVGLHLKGNLDFELEMQPSASGFGLFWETLRGATPTLAPGTMVLLGLIGLAYTFRHPALRQRDATRSTPG